MELTAALLTRAAQDPTQPTPVVFNLSSWATERKPLIAWFINELHEKYIIPKRLAQAWLEQDELLPLLDGLDEVPADQQAACVTVINQFRQDHLLPLAVCCRLAEYEALPEPLALEGAIQIQPLQEAQVNDYLTRINMAATDNQSRQQEQFKLLGGWFKTPLMLSIIAMTYGGVAAHTQSFPPFAILSHQHLFNAYIRRMLVYRGLTHHFSHRRTLHWLRWLANQLMTYDQTIFLLERIQPVWLKSIGLNKIRIRLILFLAGPIFGILYGLSSTLYKKDINK